MHWLTITLFEFSDKREFWHFVPDKFIKPDGKRYGLTIGQMTPQRRLLAHVLLSTGLSHKGYQQSVTIMTLETILHDLEFSCSTSLHPVSFSCYP